MRIVWEQLALPVRSLLGGADVLLSPSNLAVLGSPVPQLLMFQNLVPFSPEVIRRRRDVGRFRFGLLRHAGILSAKVAEQVVFISGAQRDAILPWLDIPPARTALVYLGRDLAFSPAAKADSPELLQRLGLRPPYLLCVSQFYHYKNLVELVRGFALALPRLGPDVQLVFAGALHEPAYVAEVRAAIAQEGLGERVRILGHLPYESLPPLCAAAALFLFPSTCESFPNILIEGLASGIPVLSSNRCSMPELAQAGAVYFNPDSPEEIGCAIADLWNDPAAQERLRAAGVAQAARYSWGATADRLLELMEQAVA